MSLSYRATFSEASVLRSIAVVLLMMSVMYVVKILLAAQAIIRVLSARPTPEQAPLLRPSSGHAAVPASRVSQHPPDGPWPSQPWLARHRRSAGPAPWLQPPVIPDRPRWRQGSSGPCCSRP